MNNTSINILNPGSITVNGSSIFDGSGVLIPDEFIVLTPQNIRVYARGRTNYNWMKFWRKPKVNTLKFRSIIRKAKRNESRG